MEIATKYLNTQLTLTWDYEQTRQQYEEVLDGELYGEDEFFEYVASNFLEWLRNSSDKELMREIRILDDGGEVID